jgi:hypothetical protein
MSDCSAKAFATPSASYEHGYHDAMMVADRRIRELESLVCDMGEAFIHDNCYRWCEAQSPCMLMTTGKCQYRERMAALGLEER